MNELRLMSEADMLRQRLERRLEMARRAIAAPTWPEEISTTDEPNEDEKGEEQCTNQTR